MRNHFQVTAYNVLSSSSSPSFSGGCYWAAYANLQAVQLHIGPTEYRHSRKWISNGKTLTRSFAFAEGLHDELVSRNPATTKHPIWKRLQLTNHLEAYTPKVIAIAAYIISCYWPVVIMSLSSTVFEILPLFKWKWLLVTLRTPSLWTTRHT